LFRFGFSICYVYVRKDEALRSSYMTHAEAVVIAEAIAKPPDYDNPAERRGGASLLNRPCGSAILFGSRPSLDAAQVASRNTQVKYCFIAIRGLITRRAAMGKHRENNNLPLSVRAIAEWERRVSEQREHIADLKKKGEPIIKAQSKLKRFQVFLEQLRTHRAIIQELMTPDPYPERKTASTTPGPDLS
jgi:hypothetical protein